MNFLKFFLLALLIILSISSCKIDNKSNIEIDYLGKSDFFIIGKNDMTYYYSFNIDNSKIVGNTNSTSKQLFLSNVAGSEGIYASPSEVFLSIKIYSDSDFTKLVYSQDAISDEIWIHETPEGYDYWKYAYFTLDINQILQ